MLMKLFISLFSSVFLFMPSFSTKLWKNPENDSLIGSSNRSADDANLGNVLQPENGDDDFVSILIKTDQKQIDQFLEEIYDECGEKKEKNLEIINKILKIGRKNDEKALSFGYKQRTDEQKIEIIHQFVTMQKELDKNGMRKYENVNEIAEKLGVDFATLIYKWMHKFGLSHLLVNETKKIRKSVGMASKPSPKGRTSEVWAYFEQIPNIPKVKCTECGRQIHGHISNMKRHLQGKHKLLI